MPSINYLRGKVMEKGENTGNLIISSLPKFFFTPLKILIIILATLIVICKLLGECNTILSNYNMYYSPRILLHLPIEMLFVQFMSAPQVP